MCDNGRKVDQIVQVGIDMLREAFTTNDDALYMRRDHVCYCVASVARPSMGMEI